MIWAYFNGELILDNPLAAFMILFVNSLAVYRLSRLVARDGIFERPRNALSARYHGMLVTLLTCMWCLSFWFGIVAVLLTVWSTTREAWLAIAAILSLSAIAGQLSERA